MGEKRVNHRAAVREIRERYATERRIDEPDIEYLLRRIDSLQRQLDDERDATDAAYAEQAFQKAHA